MEAGADTQAFNADLSETAENKVLDELKSSGCNVVDVPIRHLAGSLPEGHQREHLRSG